GGPRPACASTKSASTTTCPAGPKPSTSGWTTSPSGAPEASHPGAWGDVTAPGAVLLIDALVRKLLTRGDDASTRRLEALGHAAGTGAPHARGSGARGPDPLGPAPRTAGQDHPLRWLRERLQRVGPDSQ